MKSLNFDDGRVEYCISGDKSRIIRVNLTDEALLTRLDKALTRINELVSELRELEKRDDLSVFDEIEAIREKVREQLNYAFDYDVSTPVFGGLSPFAESNGELLIFRFLNAIMPEIEKSMDEYVKIREKSDERVKKYTENYED